ncbi:TPA: restriction endonuclease [Escherichia coli]|uniref:restriction endonuclease n=1 Tax=Escherichia coli TaxID=562 RepID=UPI000B7F9425|nr:restriction endonuclease [Escherichia coli]EFA4233667.1 restriction endonuclease [Escherichia coli O40:H32]EHL6582587.1 restriction endonuclease [Escherichia coli]MBB6979877.1 restriction endonuclease [Escherichia coli]MBB8409342.1 restriction endonuclease [Escherichia coli]MBB9186924.1 restriction endonuclease [Escherichia coli]
MIERHQFEVLLSKATEQLTQDLKKSTEFHSSKYFEQQVRVVLHEILKDMGILVDMSPPAQEFPDIIIGNFGVEVKYSDKNTWRSIANSIFEGSRKQGVDHVYLLFGKVGGEPEVRWGRYEDSIMHVRTSHVPRFEVEIDAKEPLFKKLNISYNDFRVLSPEEKMPYIRDYAKRRLKSGERLWWIDDQPDARSLPLEVRLYTKLTQNEKRRYRAESAVLCPQILRSSRVKGKYDDITMFLLTYYGILCNQARDLFTAGSVAMRASDERGGVYVLRALEDIENEMYEAFHSLEDALFVEYWGEKIPHEKRVEYWLNKADSYMKEWSDIMPSNVLFLNIK